MMRYLLGIIMFYLLGSVCNIPIVKRSPPPNQPGPQCGKYNYTIAINQHRNGGLVLGAGHYPHDCWIKGGVLESCL